MANQREDVRQAEGKGVCLGDINECIVNLPRDQKCNTEMMIIRIQEALARKNRFSPKAAAHLFFIWIEMRGSG